MPPSENNFPICKYKLILASGSPRRKELLSGLGISYEHEPTHADESFPENLIAENIPLYLAEKKSFSFPRNLNEDELLLTADTIVWVEGSVLNKPTDRQEAFEMLKKLSGKKHEVFTAICLRNSQKKKTFYECTEVYFKDLSDLEIAFYIDNFPVYDKAGSYGVQDWIGYVGIEKINGSFYNVMGLPVKILYEELSKF